MIVRGGKNTKAAPSGRLRSSLDSALARDRRRRPQGAGHHHCHRAVERLTFTGESSQVIRARVKGRPSVSSRRVTESSYRSLATMLAVNRTVGIVLVSLLPEPVAIVGGSSGDD